MGISPFRNFAKEIFGGVSSAIVSISGNIIFGIIAFAPLGNDYMALGIMAGFYCSILVGLSAAILGGAPGMISGPRAPIALVFSSVLIYLMTRLDINSAGNIAVILSLAFLTVFMAGFIQTAFGLFRFGNLIKFISYPVIAGFLNATAILILATQVWAFLGIEAQGSLLNIFNISAEIKPFSMLITFFTVFIIWGSSRISGKIPGSILALVMGAVLYHVLMFVGFKSYLGPTISQISIDIPKPEYAVEFFRLIVNKDILGILPALIPAALSIAVLSSTDSLLTSLIMQKETNKRTDGNRVLVGQGIGNMLSASFGGIAGGGSLTRSIANLQAGGRGRLSGIFNTIFVLILIFSLSSVIGLIPRSVIAGIVIVLAFTIIDKWSLRLLKRIVFKKGFKHRELLGNFLIILLVVLISILVNLIVAVIIGVALSILLFVFRMSKASIIRRSYSGALVHSRKQRDVKLMDLLSKYGNLIKVLELDGSIFFASLDILTQAVERLVSEGAAYIILDMKRIRDIDSTGAFIIEQSYLKLSKEQKVLSLSYLQQDGPIWRFLEDIGLFQKMDRRYVFADTDNALEYFEDIIIKEYWDELVAGGKTQFSIFQGLDKEELDILKKFLKTKRFNNKEYVFKQGDAGRTMYLIAKGLANITIDLPGVARKKRLQTLTPGTFFGEMALLEGKPRSANVEAVRGLVCYTLSEKDFELLKREHPQISLKLIGNISRTIATRLRYANITISELEI